MAAILKNAFYIALGTIEIWWKSAWAKVRYVLDAVGLIKLPSDTGEIFDGAGMSPVSIVLLVIAVAALYLSNREFWHGLLNRERPASELPPLRRVRTMIEPSHVIVFGLLIALSGALWGHFRTQTVDRSQVTEPPSSAAHTQGPMPDAEPGLAWKGTPLAWNDRPGANVLLPVDGKPHIQSFVLIGFNAGNEEVELKDAYIVSQITGSRLKMRVVATAGNTSGQADPAEVNPIPRRAYITFVSDVFRGEQGLPEKEFLDQWGGIDFVLEFDRDKKVRINFSREILKRYLFPNDAAQPTRPHVTRRTR